MRLQLLAFGRLKTPGMSDAVEHYSKHLRSFCDFRVTELKPVPLPDKSASTRLKVQKKESKLLIDALPASSPLYLLDEKGKARSSREWASLFRSWEDSGRAEIVLAIGSSIGFGEEVRERAQGLLSLGPQTLPHELARVALIEQLYRSVSQLRGHPYHNEGS